MKSAAFHWCSLAVFREHDYEHFSFIRAENFWRAEHEHPVLQSYEWYFISHFELWGSDIASEDGR
jgi:hypothetical protein